MLLLLILGMISLTEPRVIFIKIEVSNSKIFTWKDIILNKIIERNIELLIDANIKIPLKLLLIIFTEKKITYILHLLFFKIEINKY